MKRAHKKWIFVFLLLAIISCKKEAKTQTNTIEITNSKLTETKKIEIVKYYLKNKKKLAEKDFYKIIFLNDNIDNVKVIHYKGRDSFFTFKFSEALQFYKNNNQ